jgi:hypothetical protein
MAPSPPPSPAPPPVSPAMGSVKEPHWRPAPASPRHRLLRAHCVRRATHPRSPAHNHAACHGLRGEPRWRPHPSPSLPHPRPLDRGGAHVPPAGPGGDPAPKPRSAMLRLGGSQQPAAAPPPPLFPSWRTCPGPRGLPWAPCGIPTAGSRPPRPGAIDTSAHCRPPAWRAPTGQRAASGAQGGHRAGWTWAVWGWGEQEIEGI